MVVPHPDEPGRVLAVVATFSTSTPGTRSPEDGPEGRHPMVVVGPHNASVQGGPDAGRPRSPRRPSRAGVARWPARRAGRSRGPRMCATPRIHDGEAARAASAATVGVSSLASWRSTSTPQSVPSPDTVSPSASSRRSAPMSARRSRSRSPAWVVEAGPARMGPGHRRRARRRGRARRWTGPVRRPGRQGRWGRVDPPGVGVRVVDDHGGPRRPRRSSRYGQARHRLADVVDGDALVVARRREEQPGDEL